MRPLPLHRSLVFWSGLLIFAFILWAWVESMKHHSSWTRYRRPDAWQIANHGSALSFKKARLVPFEGTSVLVVRDGPPRWARVTEHPADRHGKRWFPSAIQWKGADRYYEPFDHRYLMWARPSSMAIAHWVVLLVYLPLWLGLSIWRARRIAMLRASIAKGVEA